MLRELRARASRYRQGGGGGDAYLDADGMVNLGQLVREAHGGGVMGVGFGAHRAVGVVYDPAGARAGSWAPTAVPRRDDAFCYVDASRAIDTFEAPDRLGAFAPDVEAAPRAASSDAPQIASPARASPQPTGPVDVQP